MQVAIGHRCIATESHARDVGLMGREMRSDEIESGSFDYASFHSINHAACLGFAFQSDRSG